MHVHLEHFETPAYLQLFLVYGVTSVRSMDGRPYILDWKRQAESGALPSPAIYTAGPVLDGDPPARPDNTVVRNAQEARNAVNAQADAGYEFIKIYSNLSQEAFSAIVTAARDIAATRTIAGVMVNGRWLAASDLQAMRTAVEEVAANSK